MNNFKEIHLIYIIKIKRRKNSTTQEIFFLFIFLIKLTKEIK